MTPQEWQEALDVRYPNGANIRPEGFDDTLIVPRLMVLGVEGDVATIRAVPMGDIYVNATLHVTGFADSQQGTILRGPTQSWFISGNVPTGDTPQAAELKALRSTDRYTRDQIGEAP